MHNASEQQVKTARRPTRDDVASEAQLSGATVWRVLSGRTDVSISEETRAKVLEAARRLGYQVNASARALMTGKSGLVGFWMSLAYSRYRSQVLDHMRAILGQTELAMAVTDVDEEFHWDHSFSRALRVPVDGIIAFDTSASGEIFAQNHHRLAPYTPFVSMGAYWSEAKSFVGIDLAAGADEAMDHLIGTARKRIAYIAPVASGLLNEGVRYEAYAKKMSEAGLEPLVLSCEKVSPKSLEETLRSASTTPEALLCMNDDLALVTATAAGRLGLKVGQDLAIVGFDGLEETEYAACPITTVRQPIEEMCSLTWQFLKAQIEDPTAPIQQRILKPELVIRDSSRA
ncbi:MAG TPA: LacI family DNA-binding transcriptional regulator [Fimbriimonas sp.]|nr:LacI family DNA-binding transcriptional regulator [Fimbriimonas sp.]